MTRPERDQTKAAQPNVKASKRRVLQWLHQQQQQGQVLTSPPAAPSAAAAVPQPQKAMPNTAYGCNGQNRLPAAFVDRPAADNDMGSMTVTGADSRKTSARKKAAQLWKKWKSAMGMAGSKSMLSAGLPSSKSSSIKLSQGLLQRHQQEQEYLVDSPTTPATILYGSLAARSRGLHTFATVGSASEAADVDVPMASQPVSPTAAAVSAAAAGMPGNMVRAFNSSLYEQAAPPRTPPGTTPRNSSNDPHPADATTTVPAATEVEVDWLKLNSVTAGHAAAAATWASAIGGPSVMAVAEGPAAAGQVPLVAQASSGSGTSSVLSPKTPLGQSTSAEPVRPQPGEGSMLQMQSSSFVTSTPTCQQQDIYSQKRAKPSTLPWQGPQGTSNQLPSQPKLAAVRGDSGLQGAAHSGQAPASGSLVGTALTAYPAVAAEVVRSGLGSDRRLCAIMQGKPLACNLTSSWQVSSAAHAGNSSSWCQDSAAANMCAEASNVSSAVDSSLHSGAAGADTDVSGWLLRAALLEDELQGRALEVQELLQQLAEKRAAVQAALSSMQGGRATQRHRATLELSAISSSVKQLTGRAAGLGSGLSVLQGCQTVLGSSRGARLDPCSKVAVLQLVMSEVLNRLPDEGLGKLEICQGLPSLGKTPKLDDDRLDQARPGSIRLDQAGREVCRLAGVEPERLARVNSGRSNTTNPHSRAAVSMYASATAAYPAPSSGGYAVVETCDTVCFDDEQQEQQQQLHQEQQHWHRYDDADSSDDESCSDDDDVITTLSSVLSSRHYTPRKSLSYETRKAALTAARSGPWASATAVAASAPAVPWGAPGQQAAGNPAACMAAAAARAGHGPRIDGSYDEVSLLNGSSHQHPAGAISQTRDARGRFWDQTSAARQLPPAGPPAAAAAGPSLEHLLASGPAGRSRRTPQMCVPLRSSRAGSVAFSDAESVYSVMSQFGVEGGLPAWPEESEEYGLESFTAAAVDCDHLGGPAQLQQWCGDDDGSSSSTSCVTALSDLGEEYEERLCYSTSNSMTGTMHEARVQQMTCGAAAAGSSRASVAAPNVPTSRNTSSTRVNTKSAVLAGPSAAAGLPGNVESAPLHQVLSSAGAGESVDLNTMTVGDLLRALTQAVVRRQFN